MVELGFHVQTAAHHRNDVAHNGHAQARSLLARAAFHGERFEHVLQEFFRHADPIVGYDERELPVPHNGTGRDIRVELDAPAFGRILHGIREQVDKQLLHAHRIAHEHARRVIGHGHGKLLALLLALDARHCDRMGKAKGFAGEGHLPVLDFRNVQHIVDEAEQVVGCRTNLDKARPHLLNVVERSVRNLQHADDNVHGRANFVAHARKKFGFRFVRSFGCMHGVFHRKLNRLLGGLVLQHDKQLVFTVEYKRADRIPHPLLAAVPSTEEGDLAALGRLDPPCADAIEQGRVGIRKSDGGRQSLVVQKVGQPVADDIAAFSTMGVTFPSAGEYRLTAKSMLSESAS